MNSRNYVLLTGATGQIGRYLLRDLLLQEQPLAVLIRSRNGIQSRQRLASVIAEWEVATGISLPTPVCLEGDTTQEGFGLCQKDREWMVDHCRTLFHNAASVDFNSSGAGKTWDNNVSSAYRTLEVCQEAKIEHLAYVSTAYVCGQRKDLVYEGDLGVGQTFRNEYEHSKFEAERIVRQSTSPDCVTVLRPAIVVGDHATGQTNSYDSFYRLAQFTATLASVADKDQAGRWKHNVRLTLTGDEPLNLVTVDWVSAAMVSILRNPDFHGKTFHLTPKTPTTMLELEQALQRCFHYDGVQFVGQQPMDLGSGTPEEQRFYDYLGDYNDYWKTDPQFDRSLTDQATAHIPEPRIDVDCLERLIDFAVRSRFGRLRKRNRVNNAVTVHGIKGRKNHELHR